MDEVTRKRLLGAAAVLGAVLVLSSLLPSRDEAAPGSAGEAGEAGEGDDAAPQVVVYDLREPMRAAPAPDAQPIKPSAPAPALQVAAAAEEPRGASLGWYVQLGSYATAAGAQAAVNAMQAAGGFGGLVQPLEKDKKKYFRARIGPFVTQNDARQAQAQAIARGFGDASVLEVWKPR